MKTIILLWFLSALCVSASPATDLARLKKEFPNHVVWPITDQTDPEVRQCFMKYQAAVERLSIGTLGDSVAALRKNVTVEVSRTRLALGRTTTTSISRHAMNQNLTWLQQKLIPYLHRLETLQRGEKI